MVWCGLSIYRCFIRNISNVYNLLKQTIRRKNYLVRGIYYEKNMESKFSYINGSRFKYYCVYATSNEVETEFARAGVKIQLYMSKILKLTVRACM